MTVAAPVIAALGVVALASGIALARDVTILTEVQAIYLERCGGCHGIQGHSAPGEVPSLRGQVGYFLCLPEARAYLVRLPSVASSPLTDEELAQLMNFVVFDLGGASELRPAHAQYSAQEVSELRSRPLNDISLARYRQQLVGRLIGECGAPSSLREYSSVPAK